MAAVRMMLSAVREEAAVLSTELATSAKVGAGEVVARTSEMEVVSPGAGYRAVEASLKQSNGGGQSILAEHLQITSTLKREVLSPGSMSPANIDTTIATTTTKTESVVAQTLKEDLGVSVREAMANASQTGAEESMDQTVDKLKP